MYRYFILLIGLGLILNSNGTIALTTIPGATLSGSPTATTFMGGVSADKGASTHTLFNTKQLLDSAVEIHVDPALTGKQGVQVTVASYNNQWFMKTTDGNWSAWDLDPHHLQPSSSAHPIQAIEKVDVTSQLAGFLGDFAIFVGIKVDNDIHYNQSPFTFKIKKLVKRKPLNDTGINVNQCYQPGSDKLVSCSSSAAKSLSVTQDGMIGLDTDSNQNSNADGLLGLSFVKVCHSGEPAGYGNCPQDPALGSNPNNWGCTLDRRTAILWEVKTDDGGLHDRDNLYTNYLPEFDPDKKYGTVSDASGFVNEVNTQGLCGLRNWRLPSVYELRNIMHFGSVTDILDVARSPTIDRNFFPNTEAASYHTETSLAGDKSYDWQVDFSTGLFYPRAIKQARSEEEKVRVRERLCDEAKFENVGPKLLLYLDVCKEY